MKDEREPAGSAAVLPGWVDRERYPFTPRRVAVPGGAMSVVDEGGGEPILFVHGLPTWSFLWRAQLRALAPRFRCVAPDLLGFGLSDRPLPAPNLADHARALGQLVSRLGLERVTLVVHDLGGPIGLAAAVAAPERIARVVILNSFAWPLEGARFRAVGGFVRSPLGRLVYERSRFTARVVLRGAFADRSRFDAVAAQYLRPLDDPAARHAAWRLGASLTGARPFLAAVAARLPVLRDRPALLLWGERDPAFRAPELARWREVFPRAAVVTFPRAGHAPQEEAPGEVAEALRGFLARGDDARAEQRPPADPG